MAYCFDTSVYINAWQRDYRPAAFHSFWEKIETYVDEGQILTTEEVRIELQRKDDQIVAWAKERPHMFVPIDIAIQNAVLTILARFPRLIDTRKNRSGADPFVIGLAKIQHLTVVTYERSSGNLQKPNIPDVCDSPAIDVECISLMDMITREGWTF
ncbi:MAG: DUF4411 family protein [Dehalococcoidia bacterium]|nr:DUF4411 family protein [Dehalococcoidia bacterium]